MIPCALTFDVEEWFHSENLRPVCPPASWEALPRRVGIGTRAILALLGRHGIRATFFVLGWVAEREPELIRHIADAGHEIACHGYGHVMPTELTRAEFCEDLVRARQVLETTCGRAIAGYRAPSFALDAERLAIVASCGFRYDSSHHPFGIHDRYGHLGDLGPSLGVDVYRAAGLVELGLPVERIGPCALPASGGGYFRLYPGAVFRALARSAIARRGHYVLYLHPWEFDPGQPHVRGAGVARTFRHYVGLSRTLPRLRRLIAMLRGMDVRFVTAWELVQEVTRAQAAAA